MSVTIHRDAYAYSKEFGPIPVYVVQSYDGKEIDGYDANMARIKELTKGLNCKVSASGFNARAKSWDNLIDDIVKTLDTYYQRQEYPPIMVIIQNYGYGIYVKGDK